MPLTHQDNGASMGGSLKEVSILKNCYISADPKGRINSYLRFLSKAQLFWCTLSSSYDHGGELCNLMVAMRGNNKAAARQGQQGKIADATINSR
jgi:hypothetical protein